MWPISMRGYEAGLGGSAEPDEQHHGDEESAKEKKAVAVSHDKGFAANLSGNDPEGLLSGSDGFRAASYELLRQLC
jgi:hypothetical protein